MAGRANPVVRLPLNEAGRDFVVGDIHGCYALVMQAMERARFDPATDRILAVGDLIDRGPDSGRCVRFLAQPYVHAVLGNHESMLLQVYAKGEPHPAVLRYVTARNGFSWWNEADAETRAKVLAAVSALPYAIEVATRRGTIGIVHADVPRAMDWPTFLGRLQAGDEEVMEVATWGRDRLQSHDLSGVAGVGRLFVGHTPMARPTRIGNVYAVETGACFGVLRDDGFMTFAEACSATNSFTTFGSMRAPADLVGVISSGRVEAPFSNLSGR